jgi:hypothetical protein
MKNMIKKYSFELFILTAFLVIVAELIWCGVLVYREVSHVCKEYNVYEEASNREKDLENRKINFAALEKETPNVSAWLSSSDKDFVIDDAILNPNTDSSNHVNGKAPLYTGKTGVLEYNVSIICGSKDSSLANLKMWQNQKVASLSDNFYLYKGKSVYKLQVIAAKQIPADDELYSYLENPEINKKNFYSSAKKDSKVETDEKFKQNNKYVILSVSSNEPNKNDVVICKVQTVDAPQKEDNDNFVIVVSILVGFALFFSLSVGSRSRY